MRPGLDDAERRLAPGEERSGKFRRALPGFGRFFVALFQFRGRTGMRSAPGWRMVFSPKQSEGAGRHTMNGFHNESRFHVLSFL
jgi:hypothetical protein